MKRTIWKFPLIHQKSRVSMPQVAEILCVQMQVNHATGQTIPTLWAIVDATTETIERTFERVGTGWDMGHADNDVYIGTVQDPGGFVWHIFEVDA